MSAPNDKIPGDIIPGVEPGAPQGKDPRRLPTAYRLQQNITYWRDRARPYHRHLSALATLGGFLGDNYFFRHANVGEMQLLFLIYLGVIAGGIITLHAITARAKPESFGRIRFILPLVTQFALGGLWSALLIFYTHAAVFTASWPFLLILVAVLIGSEVFAHYVERLVFSSILFFFGLFCSAIFLVPVYVHAIGSWVFLLSSLVTVALFLVYLRLLAFVGGSDYRRQKLWILFGGVVIMALLNGLYFTKVLPPLPLVLRDSGVFHAIKKNGDVYDARAEPRSDWDAYLGRMNVQHVKEGERLYVYSAVFAPTRLSTRIVHNWQYYSVKSKRWIAAGRISFNVNGGRDGGYRGYTRKSNPKPGDWRVDIGTSEGRLIGRVRFRVERVAETAPLVDKVIK